MNLIRAIVVIVGYYLLSLAIVNWFGNSAWLLFVVPAAALVAVYWVATQKRVLSTSQVVLYAIGAWVVSAIVNAMLPEQSNVWMLIVAVAVALVYELSIRQETSSPRSTGWQTR